MSDISYGVRWILPRQIRIIIAITDAIITGLGKRTERGQRKRKKEREKTRGNGKQRNEMLKISSLNMQHAAMSPEFSGLIHLALWWWVERNLDNIRPPQCLWATYFSGVLFMSISLLNLIKYAYFPSGCVLRLKDHIKCNQCHISNPKHITALSMNRVQGLQKHLLPKCGTWLKFYILTCKNFNMN